MLEGLDKINWRRLHTAYGSAEDAPQHLRAFLSPDEEERKNAYTYILYYINHQYDIYDSTIESAPFLVELLSNEDALDREEILFLLDSFAMSINRTLNHISSIDYFGGLAELYTHLKAGRRVYESFLSHPDPETRECAISLVKLMRSDSPRTRLRLRHAFQKETEANLQAEILHSLIVLIPYGSDVKRLMMNYKAWFEHLVQSDKEIEVRGMAAICWLTCQSVLLGYPSWRDSIPENILQTFIGSISQHQYFYDYHPQKYTLLSLGNEILLRVFSESDLKVGVLHIIARELLYPTFSTTNLVHHLNYGDTNHVWEFFLESRDITESAIYRFESNRFAKSSNLDLSTPANNKKRAVLQAIVDRDRFWELKTNCNQPLNRAIQK